GAQPRHYGHGAFAAGDELGVEERLGRVVDDGDEGLIGVRREGKPAMAAAVEMNQLAEAGPRFPTPAMAAPGAALGDEAGRLQGELDEGVGEPDRMLAPGDVMEVADIEPGVAFAVQAQNPLDLDARRLEVRRPLAAALEQADHRIAF